LFAGLWPGGQGGVSVVLAARTLRRQAVVRLEKAAANTRTDLGQPSASKLNRLRLTFSDGLVGDVHLSHLSDKCGVNYCIA
jgi:hypothetical protein